MRPGIKAEVVSDPTVMSGDPVAKGTRILAETILGYLGADTSPQAIFEDYPSLPVEGDRCGGPVGGEDVWRRLEVGRAGGGHSSRDRFLIDECLSGSPAAAKARGYDAEYVPLIGKGGWQDWNPIP
jgi:hypothetical protein